HSTELSANYEYPDRRISTPHQLREGSAVAGCRTWLRAAAAAIMAALSVQSCSGGIVRRALPLTSSAARFRSSVLAATPPAITTSAGRLSSTASASLASSDSTTERSNAAARSAFCSWLG